MQHVDRALFGGRGDPAGVLDRAGHAGVLALVAQVGEDRVALVGPGGERVEQTVMGPGAGGVVLAAWAHRGGPQRPSVRGSDHLDVRAVMVVLARPPQVHPGRRTGSLGPVGADQGAVQADVGVPRRSGGEQRTVQIGCGGGERVDALVQVAAGG